MQTTAQIEFENLTPPAELQAVIEQHISELEKLYGVSAGRINVRGPVDRHEPGGQYKVNIRLALPNGREVNVGRTSKQDERYADLAYAVDDSFNQARSQLQDQEHLMGSGQTGSCEGEPVGTVVRIDPGGAFGFLESANGREIYFSFISVLEGRANITVGSRVSYVEELGEDGLQAFAVKVRAS
ncbi:HPF/RaiA family ribosome-associated protein [Bradyrhizobium erythrophlei]|uniref:HPF/RaiA family ribosome-associated protein n=1 Tax=Bradyrhizobium erythrophlei TaxID=1437360 RepID=UPI0035E95A7C